MPASSGSSLSWFLPLWDGNVLGEQSSHDHILHHGFVHEGSEAEGEGVADGAGLTRGTAGVDHAADVNLP